MPIDLYFLPFIISFLVTIALSILVSVAARFFLYSSRSGKRHAKKVTIIQRLGGIAIIGGFLAAVLADRHLFLDTTTIGIIAASIMIAVVGTWDDIREMGWKVQLLFHVAIAILVFIFGVRVDFITNPFGGIIDLSQGEFLLPSLLFGIAWLIVMMNTMNWIDGIDGLSGGVAIIGVLTIFFLSLKPEVNQPPVGIITMALTGSLVAFIE